MAKQEANASDLSAALITNVDNRVPMSPEEIAFQNAMQALYPQQGPQQTQPAGLWDKYYSPALTTLADMAKGAVSGQLLKDIPQGIGNTIGALGAGAEYATSNYPASWPAGEFISAKSDYSKSKLAKEDKKNVSLTEQAKAQKAAIDEALAKGQPAAQVAPAQSQAVTGQPVSARGGVSISAKTKTAGGAPVPVPSMEGPESYDEVAGELKDAVGFLKSKEALAASIEEGQLDAQRKFQRAQAKDIEDRAKFQSEKMSALQTEYKDFVKYSRYNGMSRREVDTNLDVLGNDKASVVQKAAAKARLVNAEKPLDVQMMSKGAVILGAALSGLSSAILGHGGNPFMDAINKQIEASWQRQSQKRQEGIEAKLNAVQMAREQFKDESTAKAAYYARSMEAFGTKFEEILASNKAMLATPQGQKMKADISLNMQKAEEDLKFKMAEEARKEADLRIRQRGMNLQEQAFKMEAGAGAGAAKGGYQLPRVYEFDPDQAGNIRPIQNAKELQGLNELAENAPRLKTAIAELRKMRNDMSFVTKGSPRVANVRISPEIYQRAGNLMTTLKSPGFENLGSQFTDKEMGLLDPSGFMEDPTKIGNFDKWLNEVERIYREKEDAVLKSRGIRRIGSQGQSWAAPDEQAVNK